jgi:hypothetical protein
MMARRCTRRATTSAFSIAFELIISKRGFALSKVYSMRVPLRPAARSHVLQLLRRAAHGVLQALRCSRERAARRIIEEHRNLLGK